MKELLPAPPYICPMKRTGIVVMIVLLLVTESLMAQCPMCRMSLESNLEDGGTMGRTINAGILYMLGMPYLLVGLLGYIWYKNRKKMEAGQEEQTNLN